VTDGEESETPASSGQSSEDEGSAAEDMNGAEWLFGAEDAAGGAGSLGLPNLGDLLSQLSNATERLEEAADEARQTVVEGSAANGAVVISLSGEMEALRVKIAPALVDPSDVAMLEDAVLAALRDALSQLSRLQAEIVEMMPGSGGAFDLSDMLGNLGGMLGNLGGNLGNLGGNLGSSLGLGNLGGALGGGLGSIFGGLAGGTGEGHPDGFEDLDEFDDLDDDEDDDEDEDEDEDDDDEDQGDDDAGEEGEPDEGGAPPSDTGGGSHLHGSGS
jgi:DNA-binding YbaB/EbfC family protein